MQDALIHPKDTVSTDFDQLQWNILYRSIIVSLIPIPVYQLLRHDQEQVLIHF